MRNAAERAIGRQLKKRRQRQPATLANIGNVEINLAVPSQVLGGRNGAGKSRLLRALASHLAEDGVVVDLHYLCEQALTVLRARDDLESMKDEFGSLGPDSDRLDDVQRIVGREYGRVDWFALEIDPSDPAAEERFRWGGDQALVPYFEVEYRGIEYSSTDMGLGEFSMHFLFWILEQYREEKTLTLLLDEPDAFLPPIGASALLSRLQKICMDRGWNLIMTTHASEIIIQAVEEETFVLLAVDDDGSTVAFHSKDDSTVADTLLDSPPIRHVFFVEDESAFVLTRVLLEAHDRRLSRACEIVWGNGSGYMTELQTHFPKPPRPEIKFAYVFDGDKRTEVGESENGRWPAIFLPTDLDPDQLLREAGRAVSALAVRLNVREPEVKVFVDSQQGKDAHDWVNDLSKRYDRPRVLRALAELWVEGHPDEVAEFDEALRQAL